MNGIPRRVLVIVTRRIGDVLLATPLIRSLKQAWPGAQIEALVFNGTIYNYPELRAELLAAATGQLAALKELGELSALEQLLAWDWARAMSSGQSRRPRHSWGRDVFPLHPEEIRIALDPLHAVQPKRYQYHPHPCSEFWIASPWRLAARMGQAWRPGWGRCREPLRCSVELPWLQLMSAYALGRLFQ